MCRYAGSMITIRCCEVCKTEFECVGQYPRKTCSNTCMNKAKSLAKRGENNPNWAGDGVGYKGVHLWVKKRYPAPQRCEGCGKKQRLDLANKGVYSRDRSQWEWLCRRCHMVKDGRLEKLKARIISMNVLPRVGSRNAPLPKP